MVTRYIAYITASHLKILIPVSTAVIIVADVKYARVSTSIPIVNMWCVHTTNMWCAHTTNMWCAHTTKPSNPIVITAKIILMSPNSSIFLFRSK
jgi:predicted ATP-dependent Lon-type protease